MGSARTFISSSVSYSRPMPDGPNAHHSHGLVQALEKTWRSARERRAGDAGAHHPSRRMWPSQKAPPPSGAFCSGLSERCGPQPEPLQLPSGDRTAELARELSI